MMKLIASGTGIHTTQALSALFVVVLIMCVIVLAAGIAWITSFYFGHVNKVTDVFELLMPCFAIAFGVVVVIGAAMAFLYQLTQHLSKG